MTENNKEPEKTEEPAKEDGSDDDDMFAADDFEIKAVEQVVQRTRREDRFLNSEVQDSEGYYIPRMGDVLNGRYPFLLVWFSYLSTVKILTWIYCIQKPRP